MRPTIAEKRATFRDLHQAGCFALPNPWDAGSAIALQGLGFKALASTSAGMAWSLGRPDQGTSVDEVLAHLASLVSAVDVPVNADFENAYADRPADVAANVTLAVKTGIAGLSVEDSTRGAAEPLYEIGLAVDRIKAAREAIDRAGGGVLLTARSEGFIAGRPDLAETIRRLQAYAAAGADCLFAPGIKSEDDIRAVVAAVAPKPVNVLTLGLAVPKLAELGVRRVSVGGALARAAWAGFLGAARELAGPGTVGSLAQATPSAELNGLFASRRAGV